MCIFTINYSDCPTELAYTFQDPATGIMQGIIKFNYNLIFIIIQIVSFVFWIIVVILTNFQEWALCKSVHFYEHPELEITWTMVPCLILFTILAPSLTLLYSFEANKFPELNIKAIGNQWFWKYEYSDLNKKLKRIMKYKRGNVKVPIKFSCYMVPVTDILKDGLPTGMFWLLDTTKRVVIPTGTNVRLLVTSMDVLHSWSIPSFGIKIDACPGRVNQVFIFLKRSGMFYGQCSEICGSNHGFMPIVCAGLHLRHFQDLLFKNLLKFYLTFEEVSV